MKKEELRANKGMSMADIIIAVLILCMFVGVIGNLYYQIAYHSQMIRLNAIAVYYCINIAENIDKIAYEEVTEELNNSITTTYQIPDFVTITINVENYNQNDTTKEDIMKIVTIKAEYQCFEDTMTYELKKLKIKEI